jgi:hypothetical protein
MLDEEFAQNFNKPWAIQYSDGKTIEYDTEDQACEAQRVHRVAIGLNPMTGE